MHDQQVFHLYKSLPAEFKQEVRDFIEFLLSKKQEPQPTQSPNPLKRNAFGVLAGKVSMSPDFDAPLADFEEYM